MQNYSGRGWLKELPCPSGFEPVRYQKIQLLDGQIVDIPVAHLTFKRWMGTPITYTFGCKPIVEHDGEAMFAELAIKHRVTQTLEWSAQWVEGRYYLEKWHDVPFAHQIRKPVGRLRPADTISSIDTACNNICSKHRLKSYSGCWDVVAWKQDAILFIESKHLNKDSIRDTQIRWLSAALSSLTHCYFLIVEWLYEDEEPAADVSAHLLTQV